MVSMEDAWSTGNGSLHLPSKVCSSLLIPADVGESKHRMPNHPSSYKQQKILIINDFQTTFKLVVIL